MNPAPPESDPCILVIEDEPPLRRFLKLTLETQDYRIIEAMTGAQGLQQAAAMKPDLVILDLGLPDMDGLTVIQRLREWSKLPILVVSARGKEHEKVAALDGGADDYLTKPFGVGELLARLRVAMRHQTAGPTDEPVFTVGDLVIDLAARRVAIGGQPVHLTRTEFRMLAVLVKHAGRVVTHRQLLREVWGPEATEEGHYLRVYMNQLRQKLELDPSRPKYLLTETGVGYRLACDG
jgi:two-component system KDP operon response regulator KdpE